MAQLMKNARLVKNAATRIKTNVINTMSKAKFDFSKINKCPGGVRGGGVVRGGRNWN
jgi:hypothetical protein